MIKTCTLLAVLAPLAAALATPQKFANSYEAKTLSKGQSEFETNVTWSHLTGENGFVFEHELEWGITDHFQLSALAEWEYARISGEGSSSAFVHAGLEGIYQLSSPTTDPLGIALLGEVAIGDNEFVLEPRLLISKDIGKLTLVYNAGFAALWEGDGYNDSVCEFGQSFGASYSINPHFMLGVEAVHEATFANWSTTESNALFLGPNIGLRKGNLWCVLSGGWQVTNDDAAADYAVKLRVGFVF